jgi:cobalt-zinc-cadmium efflux system outer membrane protein
VGTGWWMAVLWLTAASVAEGRDPPAVSEGTSLRAQLEQIASRRGGAESDLDEAAVEARLHAGVSAYVALVLEQSPEVQAAFARWRGAVHRIARARALPEPVVSLGVYAQAVETRVGPQQAKLSLQQVFPWPTSLIAGADAASLDAQAAQLALEAVALAVSRRVRDAYWTLWELRITRRTHRDHLNVLEGLSATVRARLEVGRATLADLQQVDLGRARLAERIHSLDEQELQGVSTLRAALGLEQLDVLPTSVGPLPAVLPLEELDVLVAAARKNPQIARLGSLADGMQARSRVAAAARAPRLKLGVDWVLTGPAVSPEMVDSGKDAVMVGVGISLPLWQGTYAHAVGAARADAEALRSDQRSWQVMAVAEVERAMSRVRDSERRVRVTADTLLPQAEAAYSSLLGTYVAGESTVAQTLLVQQDLLDLRVDVDRARAAHARAWAALEHVCGREILTSTSLSVEETP